MLVFDVGQGTSVLIRTSHHQLLYDTGPLYTENFDAGSGIIVPYLQSQALAALAARALSLQVMVQDGNVYVSSDTDNVEIVIETLKA